MSKKPYRVALVTHDLSTGGGTATVVAYLHRVLSDSADYSPHIVSLSTSMRDDMSVRLLSPGTWKSGIRTQERTWRDLEYTHFGAHFTELEFQRYKPRKILTDHLNQFDIIQIVDGTPAWGAVALRCRKPVLLQMATTIRVERQARLEKESGIKRVLLELMTWLNERTELHVLRRMNRVFVENQNAYNRVSRVIPQRKVIMAPPGIDTEFFTRGHWDSKNYILAVGRFSDPRKNVRMLLQAYSQLCQALPDAPRLVLVGEAPTPENLELLEQLKIAGRVQVHVNVSQDELAELYRGAGLFVLSSDEEGLGLVILEAMASGLPVVSTDCGGPTTAVTEGKTGFLTPIGDAAALADAMKRILEDPALGQRLGQAGWEVAQERFSLEATGRAFMDVYAELVNGKRRVK